MSRMSRHQRRVYILLGLVLAYGGCVALANGIEDRAGDAFAVLSVVLILVIHRHLRRWMEP